TGFTVIRPDSKWLDPPPKRRAARLVLEQLEPRIAPATQFLPEPLCAPEQNDLFRAAQLQPLPSNTTATRQTTPAAPAVNTAAIDAALRDQLDATNHALSSSNSALENALVSSGPAGLTTQNGTNQHLWTEALENPPWTALAGETVTTQSSMDTG